MLLLSQRMVTKYLRCLIILYNISDQRMWFKLSQIVACRMLWQLLEANYQHLYWTPCVAHCMDLILEDTGKLNNNMQTLKRAITLNSYLYTRPGVLNMMRQFTGQSELLRLAKTRFATVFLTLASIHKQKENLRKMFSSNEWTKGNWAKEVLG
ncbi:DUF659 domain-containing protein [Cephalotus follicularis]|uniref:DUF659 domain-containing protein n=1 Tax=Cephalotus follicularis TaxID=3775 RepID=A0A1Q3AMJ2_CEPFO|nr:DUF659 domain-containing protein [Cephalotus follicularis]